MTRSKRADDYAYFNNDGRPLAFAHRGGSVSDDHRLENTMAAFQTAVDLGFRYLETDVRATSDGVLVASHDERLDRTAGIDRAVADMTYAEVSRARINGQEPLARLDDMLSTWPEARFNIDAKSVSAITLVGDTIRTHRAWDRVCLASFSALTLGRLRRLLPPQVPTSFSVPGVATLRLLPVHALRSLALRAGVAAQVPQHRVGLEIVTPAFIERAHRLGKQVHVWTVDDAAEINRLLDLGVDGIVSDRIDILRETYLARGIWGCETP